MRFLFKCDEKADIEGYCRDVLGIEPEWQVRYLFCKSSWDALDSYFKIQGISVQKIQYNQKVTYVITGADGEKTVFNDGDSFIDYIESWGRKIDPVSSYVEISYLLDSGDVNLDVYHIRMDEMVTNYVDISTSLQMDFCSQAMNYGLVIVYQEYWDQFDNLRLRKKE